MSDFDPWAKGYGIPPWNPEWDADRPPITLKKFGRAIEIPKAVLERYRGTSLDAAIVVAVCQKWKTELARRLLDADE